MANATMKSKACSTKKSAANMESMGSMKSAARCEAPKCDIRMEECQDGCMIYCTCEDQAACKMLQSLCRAMATGICSICCTRNGKTICECNFAHCLCSCELTSDGICICCKTDDKACVKMVQAACRCLCCCLECGCDCTVCLNETTICHRDC